MLPALPPRPCGPVFAHVRDEKCAACRELLEELLRDSELSLFLHRSRN
jgi:hypothetical protein